ncbi:polyprenyl synthetase family protein [Bacillus ndiopicus]|uniref:polyprenyl synthetase family protein n=1 Tax=Bacillus ndiopicus TaxID=1347368 RepID=UPI0005A82176|nr:polyprenyl synthetase family protein [Bacillus ndiopicus]
MTEWHSHIKNHLEKIVALENSLDEQLVSLMQQFIREKEQQGFAFGTLCVLHYVEYVEQLQDEIFDVAAAIELLILAFDIVDDLQDGDKDYVWMKTPALSLNVVLTMLTVASKIIGASSFTHRHEAIQIVEQYMLCSINGQHLDLLNHYRDEQAYISMIQQKSGSLVAMSCEVGVVLASGKRLQGVAQYAQAIGILQQIKNDIHNVTTEGSDLRQRKYSLPIFYMLTLQNKDASMIQSYYNGDTIQSIEHLQQLLVSNGAIRYALTMKNIYSKEAQTLIENTLTNDENKKYLLKMMK